MRKIPDSVQKVFNFVRSQGRANVYQIAKDLDLDYKNIYVAVKRCEELGLLSSVMERSNNRPVKIVFPRPEIVDLRIESVFLESGSRLLKRKELRRKSYFEMHGSMSLSEGASLNQEPTQGQADLNPRLKLPPSATLRKKAFAA